MTHFAIWSQCRRWQDPSNIKQNPAQALNLQALCPSLDIGWQECKHRFLGGRQAAECAKQSIRKMPEMQTSTVTRRLTGDAWYVVMLPTDLNSCVKFLIRPYKFPRITKIRTRAQYSAKRWILGCVIPRPGSLWPRGRYNTTKCSPFSWVLYFV